MHVTASWLHSGVRTLVLGALVAAAWIIFGAGSAQASGPLSPLSDAVQNVVGDSAASPAVSSVPGDAAANKQAEGPVVALLEPAATIAGPLAPQAQQIIDPVLAPVDTALTPTAAPMTAVIEDVTRVVEPVTGLASDALSPVTTPVAELTAPVTGLIAEVAAPVTAPVGSLLADTTEVLNEGDITAAAPALEPPAPAVPVAMNDASPGEGQSTVSAAAFPSLQSSDAIDLYKRLPLKDGEAFRATSAADEAPAMRVQRPAPDLPASPAGSPATGPTGAGSSSRAGSEAGPTLASDLAGFQFSLQHSPLKEVIRSSDELPGSVSLEHGFSPD